MTSRYDIIKGTVPKGDPAPVNTAKLSKSERLDKEITALISAHDKIVSVRDDGDQEFRNRARTLYLQGQVSEKAYKALSRKYGWDIYRVAQPVNLGSGSCGSSDGGRC